MTNYILCPDAFLHISNGKWLLSNPRTRTHVALDREVLESFAAFPRGAAEEAWERSLQNKFGQDSTMDLYGVSSLHGDHSGVSQDLGVSKQGRELFQLLTKRWLLVKDDLKEYYRFFAPLTSSLDRNHLGSFHQRVGQNLTINMRLKLDERWRWWQDQKFMDNGKAIKPGPYKEIQESFINNYFSKKDVRGLKILDFGCGNGFYSAKFANWGAQVFGVDTSEELIELAKKNYKSKADFIYLKSEDEMLNFLASSKKKFDMIFMQDVMLLLFKPENGRVYNNLDKLLRLFRDALKPSGKLYAMELNSVFFLAGRYGNPLDPYAIVTEHRNQVFNVVPLLADIIEKMGKAGFGLIEYSHPEHSAKNEPDYSYCNKYCIWDFMCFVPVKKENGD